jgi:SAM-dependent methyltransferase
MLARAKLPLRYELWNLKWGAPSGRLIRAMISRERRATRWAAPLVGCFAYQGNNSTRAFEYPWAFEALRLTPGMRVLEIGGGLSGFQFVIAQNGCEIINVDPGEEFHTSGWPLTVETVSRINRLFGTRVELKRCRLEEAVLPAASFDRVVSISVFEHIPEPALEIIFREVRRILRPGGILVLTVDLFLNVHPFAAAVSNEYGHNVSVKWLVERSGMELIHGRQEELFGYQEFRPEDIDKRRSEFLIGKYPAMVQTLVLRKPNA